MRELFNIVAQSLLGISAMTGLTYNEINIIVYYFAIPMMFFVMADKIIKKHILKISLSMLSLPVLALTDFKKFSDWLFAVSVDFLNLFEAIGWNYTVSSVTICVFVPAVVFMVLFYFSYWPDVKSFMALGEK